MTRMQAPTAPHVLAIVQAGGQGSRMDVLTRERAKPALPYAGDYRLVDLAISLAVCAGISDVWVTVQYMASSLDEHLQHGRPWDLDRVRGGYRRMVPESGRTGAPALSGSNTEDLLAIRDQVEAHAPDVVVTLSADQVLVCDLAGIVDEHVRSGAECTLLSLTTDADTARHKAVLEVDGDRVTAITEKPDDPGENPLVSAEVAVYDWTALRGVLDEVRAERAHVAGSPASDDDPGDLPEEVLPRLVARGGTHHHPVEGYWRDMGRPSAYLQGHRDLVDDPSAVFGSEHLRVRGSHRDLPPARVTGAGRVTDSLLAAGTMVGGTVERSVLGAGVVVEPGAHVVDSVLFDDVRVESGARVVSALVDEHATIGADALVGSAAPATATDEDVTLVGRDAVVHAGARLPAGARLEPGGTADQGA